MVRKLVPAFLLMVSCVALAGCSSATSETSSTAPTPISSSPPSSDRGPAVSPTARTGSAKGTITFDGALSGTMTIASCHDGLAQLVVAIAGQSQTYSGLIDAEDFTFAVPHSTGYTLADGASKPRVSGTTYTVRNTKLVSITNDDVVTANGSVTCP